MYKLISTNYSHARPVMVRLQDVKEDDVPNGAIRSNNGNYYLLSETESLPARFEMTFEDKDGQRYIFDAYRIIKDTMKGKNLTVTKRKKVENYVSKISAKSVSYRPEDWVIDAVKFSGIWGAKRGGKFCRLFLRILNFKIILQICNTCSINPNAIDVIWDIW